MMGFAGYVLPGSVFIAFGLKWSLDATSDIPSDPYTTLDDSRSSSKGSRISQKKRRRCKCRLRDWPFEGLVKLGVAVIGSLILLCSAFKNGELRHVEDVLFATVYLIFALSGFVDVLVFYCSTVMPFGLDKFALSLAFTMEGLMIHLHQNHESFMNQHVHVLLVCAIFASALATLAEVVMPWSRIVRFIRAYFTLVHGSWYIQSGFILFNPSQNSLTWASGNDYNNALTWISLTYAWHCGGALVIMLILMALSRKNRAPVLPRVEPFEPEHELRSVTSIPRCQFSSSLSNYADLKS